MAGASESQGDKRKYSSSFHNVERRSLNFLTRRKVYVTNSADCNLKTVLRAHFTEIKGVPLVELFRANIPLVRAAIYSPQIVHCRIDLQEVTQRFSLQHAIKCQQFIERET